MSEPSIPHWARALALGLKGGELLEEEERVDRLERARDISRRGSSIAPLSDTALGLGRAIVARLTPFATAPLSPRRLEAEAQRATLWIERDAPTRAIASLSEAHPALLWFPVGDSAALAQRALAPYQRATAAPPTLAMPRRARAFAGTPGLLGFEREELFARFSSHPLSESLIWGSAHAEDPWPEVIDAEKAAAIDAGQMAAQDDGRPWSVSFRSAVSRSALKLEDHDGFFVLEARYAPCDHAELFDALTAPFGVRWPHDLPVDLASLLIGLLFETEDALRSAPPAPGREPDDDQVFDLYAWAAVTHAEPRALELLEAWARSTSVEARTSAADIAIRHGYGALIALMAGGEPDATLRDQIAARLV